ncbi:hypothetical protein ACPCKP_33885 [Streptomyces cellulosae]
MSQDEAAAVTEAVLTVLAQRINPGRGRRPRLPAPGALGTETDRSQGAAGRGTVNRSV